MNSGDSPPSWTPYLCFSSKFVKMPAFAQKEQKEAKTVNQRGASLMMA